MKIHEKIAKIMKELEYLNKDTAIQTRKGSYNVISEPQVLKAVRPKLLENNLVLVPTEMHPVRTGTVTTIQIVWKLWDVDSDESIQLSSVGQGHDEFDKGAGMAQTYALKYLLLKLFQIITGDDPDYTASDAHAEHQEQKSQAAALALPNVNEEQTYRFVSNFNTLARERKLAGADEAGAFQGQLDSVHKGGDDDETKIARMSKAFNLIKKAFVDAGEVVTAEEIWNVG